MTKKNYSFQTQVIHAANSPEDWNGATIAPIYQSVSHVHSTADNLSESFSGTKPDYIYMRLANPTNRTLEEKLKILENGRGALVMSSGMAAITNTCMALLRSGDEFIAGKSLFLSTYVFFTRILKKYGITSHLVEIDNEKGIENAINEKTRFIYLETIGNPKMDVPDIENVARIAHIHDIPLIVDNTLATPYLCRPLELGADVVIHSTTKYLSGHGNALGGVVIDGGSFPWLENRFPDFRTYVEQKGSLALLDKIWREHHINFGTTQSPMHSYLTMIGLDTLVLRMEKHLDNAMRVALFLKERPEVSWVNYPGLENHASHYTAKKQFDDKGFGGMLTFGLEDQTKCFRFINSLQLILNLANLGDCKSLVIHPYSTQYVSFDESTKKSLLISPDMIRLSVGIEAIKDICEDLGEALDSVSK